MDANVLLREKITSYIPLTRQMNISVERIEPLSVTLKAPFDLNKNHMDSVFGGSLYIMAVLSCWGLTEEALKLRGIKPKYTMIKKGSMDYRKPVKGDFYARSMATQEDMERFLEALQRKGLGRIELRSEVFYEDIICAELVGEFVSALEK